MIRVPLIALQTMILVHNVDGKAVAVNMEQVVSLSLPGKEMTSKSNCLITVGGGRFINTHETCREIGLLWQHEDAKVK
jgi:hypothetical protein